MTSTRAASAGLTPFPNAPQITKLEQVPPYLNNLGNWIKSAVDSLTFSAKNIPYASVNSPPPLAGPPRIVAFPDDPVYGQILAYNGVGPSGTTTGWWRLVVDGTITSPAAFKTNGTQTTVGTAGAASALPANPNGYLKVSISGSNVLIPFYST